jgi:hypothetical protein
MAGAWGRSSSRLPPRVLRPTVFAFNGRSGVGLPGWHRRPQKLDTVRELANCLNLQLDIAIAFDLLNERGAQEAFEMNNVVE